MLFSSSAILPAQFYISCGQVNVINGGNGSPGPLVAIPGVYTGRVRNQQTFLVANVQILIAVQQTGAWHFAQCLLS